MDPVKREYVLQQLGDAREPLPETPFNIDEDFPIEWQVDDVPFFPQEQIPWSGAAVLQMLAAFYGRETSQSTIARLATPEPFPAYGTETWRENARRVATLLGFGAMSYYPFRYLSLSQIVPNETRVSARDVQILKSVVSEDRPVLVRLREVRGSTVTSIDAGKWLSLVGHAVLVVGYDEQSVYLNDPWDNSQWGGQGGERIPMRWETFQDLWVDGCLDYMLVVQPPVNIDVDTIPTRVKQGQPLDLPVRITYPAHEAFAPWAPVYRNPMVTLEVTEQSGLELRVGQHPVKPLGSTFAPGACTSMRWGLLGDQEAEKRTATVLFEAVIDEPNAPFPYTSKVWQRAQVVLP